MSCPPCTNDCRQGRDCPVRAAAERRAREMTAELPREKRDLLALKGMVK